MKYRSSTMIVFALLILLLCSFFVPSLKMESSENRSMATFDMVIHPEPESITYRKSPVERLDAALSDQFPFREKLVKSYLGIFNTSEAIASSAVKSIMPKAENQYSLTAIGKYQMIEDTNYITEFPPTNPMNPDIVSLHVNQIERLHKEFPDLKFYVYFVSQAYDMPWWENYIGTKTADHYQQILDAIPSYVRCDHLVYRDLDDYMDMHYKTDHHWNHRGAQRGYEDIYTMMNKDFQMGDLLVPLSENRVSETYDFVYLGSYGRGLGELYKGGYDSFSFYEYDYPEETYAIFNSETHEEIEAVCMGIYDRYRKGKINKDIDTDHYITMYHIAIGVDGVWYAEQYPYIIRNTAGNGRNLLICGDSYNRAIRDLLASNFSTLVYVDYRVLKDNPIDDLIKRYNIDTLLISSHKSMWSTEEYMFTFEEGDE